MNLSIAELPKTGRRVVLRSRPQGVAQAEDFAIETVALRAPGPGELLVRNHFLSVEPAMRGWIADTSSYSTAVGVGEAMRSLAVGEVVASAAEGFKPGDLLVGWFDWQEFATVAATAVIGPAVHRGLPPSLALGILGINGVTAFLALTTIGKPAAGQTIVVSTAAGAVGSAVGQIAKIMGCRTVGIAGGAAKARLCEEAFGYDTAIDYRAPDFEARLAAACPDGVHVYFDNVSGPISDALHRRLAIGARIVVCGTASIASWDDWPIGPRVERHLLVKRASMQGFVIFDHMDRWVETADRLAEWVADGRLCYREEILDGLEACPDALAGLYRGENLGKRLIRL